MKKIRKEKLDLLIKFIRKTLKKDTYCIDVNKDGNGNITLYAYPINHEPQFHCNASIEIDIYEYYISIEHVDLLYISADKSITLSEINHLTSWINNTTEIIAQLVGYDM